MNQNELRTGAAAGGSQEVQLITLAHTGSEQEEDQTSFLVASRLMRTLISMIIIKHST